MNIINTSNEKFWPKTRPIVKARIPPPPEPKKVVRRLIEDKPPPPPQDRFVVAIERAIAACDVADKHEGQLARIAREVAEKHDITVQELRSHHRQRKWAWPRHEFCWRAHHETDHSYPAIGRWLGGRDHTTIMYAIRNHARRIAEGKA